MAFLSLQAEQAGGAAITLHVGLNTHEWLMAKREKATGTEGHSSQALVLLSLERETPRETWAPGPHMGDVSKPATSLRTLSLESHKCLQSSGTKSGRKDGGGNLRLCASAAAQSTIKEAGMRQGWRELRCLQSSAKVDYQRSPSVPGRKK